MQGHIYHWKHGWIPLDHVAAISKAKGNHKAAEKIMAKHGIGGGHDHNISALEVRKGSRGGHDVVHSPSGLIVSNHSTRSGAEVARHEYATTPHNLHVSGTDLRSNSGAIEHLRQVSGKHAQAEADKKHEASMVAAAKRQRPAGPKVSNPSKPGDLVVVSREHASYVNGQGRTVTEEHTPGIVTHVHSDGTPIAYRDARGSFNTVQPRDVTRSASQSEIDVNGFLQHVKATNKWHSTVGGASNVKTHYDDLQAVTAAAKRFRKAKAA